MALRDKLSERVWPLLDSGEKIESVFPAREGPSPYLLLLSGLVLLWTKFDVIVVTDRRIAVFRASIFSPTKPRALVASYSRDEPVTARQQGLWIALEVGGMTYRVGRGFNADLRVLGV